MAKIKAFLLISDPSFSFYIHYPNQPFDKKIKTQDGDIGFSLLVPTSDNYESEVKKLGTIDIGRYWIERAETGATEECDLIVECALLVTLEQEIDSQLIDEYRAYNDHIHRIEKRGESKGTVQESAIEKGESGDRPIILPSHHQEMFKICRKYLKRFLLSLREKGNVCRLKFYDYNKPESEFVYGLFGKYYYVFRLQDEQGSLLCDLRPLPSLMQGGRSKDSSVVIKPLKKPFKRQERLINVKTWEDICGDLTSEFQPSLARTFLLDSQDEVLSGNISMAIVSAAVACEIFTDRFISSKASKIGNKFYDYIIENVHEISVLDLLDVPLESLVGYSIKEKHRDLWNDLEKLFQTRNKVVHVGKCFYMSKSEKTQILVDPEKTMHFIERAYELFEILGAYES